MTTSISLLFQAGLFRKYNFVVSQLEHLTPKIRMSRDFQNVVYHFFTFKIEGDIRKFIQVKVKKQLFKCLISPSILKIQRR